MLGLVVGFLVLEFAVRVSGIGPQVLEPLTIPNYRLSEHPAIGYEYQPSYREDAEHFVAETNSDGFRDYEFRVDRPDGVVRILILGDSITAGNGIKNVDRTYPKVLERMLNDRSSIQQYQVYNMGVGGYHTSQEVATLRHKGLRFDPDYVLIGACINDVATGLDGGVYRRLLEINEGREQPTATSTGRSFLQHSRVVFLLSYYLHVLRGDSRELSTTAGGIEGPANVVHGVEILKQLEAAHGFRTLLFIIPAFDRPFDDYRHLPYHQVLRRAIARGGGIEVIDLLDDFRSTGKHGPSLARDALHPNEEGHEILARILLSRLSKIFPELRPAEPSTLR